jgi:hypothetical protein
MRGFVGACSNDPARDVAGTQIGANDEAKKVRESSSGLALVMRLSNKNRTEYARIAAVFMPSRCYEKGRYMFDIEIFKSFMVCSEYCAPAAVIQRPKVHDPRQGMRSW